MMNLETKLISMKRVNEFTILILEDDDRVNCYTGKEKLESIAKSLDKIQNILQDNDADDWTRRIEQKNFECLYNPEMNSNTNTTLKITLQV